MDTTTILLQQFANGLTVGAVYALVAAGVAIIWGVAGLINFAHGEFFMAAAFLYFFLFRVLALPYAVTAGLVLLVMAAFGAVFELSIIRPVLRRPWQAQLVTTLGVSILLMAVATVLFGSTPLQAMTPLSIRAARIGSVSVSYQRLLIVGITVLTFLGLQQFVTRTKIGKAMRAVSQNREACIVVGINVQFVAAVTFAIAATLAGLAAVMYAPLVTIYPVMGQLITIKAFVAVIIGGLGRIDTTILAAVLLGEVESFIVQFVSPSYVDAFSFIAMLVVLLLRPQGLFGRKVGIW